jgi:hypothetical protein
MSSLVLPESAHTSRPWRVHELTRDFDVEDVWALPTPGGPGDFPKLVEGFTTEDPSRSRSLIARVLWTVRERLGGLLGWDDPEEGIGGRVPSLRERMPPDLQAAAGPDVERLPFRSLYLLDDEYAAEIANKTVHGVIHLGWVENGAGTYRGQLAILVKPNGLLGRAYMAAIRPFRHTVIYPPMLRQIAEQWRERRQNR